MYLRYLVKAWKARHYYKTERAYTKAQLPCLACVWEHDPDDDETPWHWIYCDRCDWGNR